MMQTTIMNNLNMQNVFRNNTLHEFLCNDPKALFGIYVTSRYSNISSNIWKHCRYSLLLKHDLVHNVFGIKREVNISTIRLISLYCLKNCEICKQRPLTRKVTIEYNIRACSDCLYKYTIPESMFRNILSPDIYNHLEYTQRFSPKINEYFYVYWKPSIRELMKTHCNLDLDEHIRIKTEEYRRKKQLAYMRKNAYEIQNKMTEEECNDIVRNIIDTEYNNEDTIIWMDFKNKLMNVLGYDRLNINLWKSIFIQQPIKYKLRRNGKIKHNTTNS